MEEGERARSQKSEVSPPQRSADKESEVGRQTDGRGPLARRASAPEGRPLRSEEGRMGGDCQ